MIELVLVAAAAALLLRARCFFGTFIADPFLLYFLGYLVTRFIYQKVAPGVRYSFVRRLFPLMFVVSIVSLWVGGVLPYFNLAHSRSVYAGLLPQWFIGPENGNSFMWNGLGAERLFGKKIVPDSLLPTYHYFWFNVLAVLTWLSYPVIQFLGVMKGNARALVGKPTLRRSLGELFGILVVGASLSLAVAALAALLARFYS